MGTASGLIPAQHHADAVLAQAAPVQNTWYTILDTTTNACIIGITVAIWTTNETLEVRVTIDGNTLTGGTACTAGTIYHVVFDPDPRTADIIGLSNTNFLGYRAFFIEGRSVKTEVRKTTAAGVGTLYGKVIYGRWP